VHVLFVHQNFPAQFGHIAKYLAEHHSFRCTYISQQPAREFAGVELIHYEPKSGATAKNHFCSRTFENQMWHSHAVFEVLRARTDIRPDLIVGHSGFVSTLFLRELYDCPIINYFEYFYRTRNSDFDFRHDLPPTEPLHALRALARNAQLLLDLDNCDGGYSPTNWQQQQLPERYHDKIDVIFDGIDRSVWLPMTDGPRRVANWNIPDHMRIVTYVSRGMESLRGFDIFMKVAKRICDLRNDVVFVVVGEDRVAYGGDGRFTGDKTFKQWVLSQDEYDLDRILFVGRLPPRELAQLFSLSDLHIYLTAPFVLSWSLIDAMACGAVILASDTAPVREVIDDGKNGLLCGFFDVDGMVELASQVLDAPSDFAHLGESALNTIEERYSLEVCLPQMLELYQRMVG
jgi:glycosyltransferase involved in cell wall biosynthesis